MKRILLLLVFSLSCAILNAAEMRSWTGSNGKTIEAEVLGLEDDVVRIKLKTGREMNVLLSKFAEKDQQQIKKLAATEDPFDEEQEPISVSGEPYGRDVLRVSLNINALGEGVLKLEKASAPLDHSNWGELAPSEKLPKTERRRRKQETKLCFDFRDPDPIESFFPDPFNDGYRGLSIDDKKKLLVFDHKKGNKIVQLRWPGPRLNLPIDLVCDVAEFSDECFSLQMTTHGPDKQAKISVRVFCSGDSVDDSFDIVCKYGARDEMQNGQLQFRELYRKKGIKTDKPFECEFQVPKKYISPFTFYIGKNVMLDSSEEEQLHSLGIIRCEVTGYLKIDNLFEK